MPATVTTAAEGWTSSPPVPTRSLEAPGSAGGFVILGAGGGGTAWRHSLAGRGTARRHGPGGMDLVGVAMVDSAASSRSGTGRRARPLRSRRAGSATSPTTLAGRSRRFIHARMDGAGPNPSRQSPAGWPCGPPSPSKRCWQRNRADQGARLRHSRMGLDARNGHRPPRVDRRALTTTSYAAERPAFQ